MIADPLTKLHCCIRSDGGGAIVLTSEERGPRPARRRRCWVLGTGEAVSPHDDERVGRLHRVARGSLGEPRVRARRRHPDDIDVLRDLRRVHADGAAHPGGTRLLQEGRRRAVRRGRHACASAARCPTNTDGGGLSACHPGMRGMFLLVEAVRQLRGEAAGRQVADAQLACVNGTGGWFSSASTVILGVE